MGGWLTLSTADTLKNGLAEICRSDAKCLTVQATILKVAVE
jgi:hypothetical protein